MSALAFDTHRIVKRLKEVGFSDLQAEAVTDVLSESRGPGIDTILLATKADLAGFVTKADLQAGFAETKADLLKWVVGAIGLQTVVIVGAVVTLAKAL